LDREDVDLALVNETIDDAVRSLDEFSDDVVIELRHDSP
jgi:hypothetical protein